MLKRCIEALLCGCLAFALGYLAYPFLYAPAPEPGSDEPTVVVIEEEFFEDELYEDEEDEEVEDDTGLVDSDADEAWVEDAGDDDGDAEEDDTPDTRLATAAERDAASYMPKEPPVEKQRFTVIAQVPDDPAQDRVPEPLSDAKRNQLVRAVEKLAAESAKAEQQKKQKPFVSNDITAAMWQNSPVMQKMLVDRLLEKLGSLQPEELIKAMDDPAVRLDLARVTILTKLGQDGLARVKAKPMGATVLSRIFAEEEWADGLLYSGPSDKMEKTLTNLATIYTKVDNLTDPTLRRIATTTASEFAREGWPEADMTERALYYYNSAREGKLNTIFDTLRYWETRFVTGCREFESWGSPRSMAWQRDNVRLPAAGYLGACNQVQYRLRNVAGDSVFSKDYLAPLLKYTNNTTAWAHREIGGVCGACSHYGAYAALAAGIPASTVGEPGHCAYCVRVGDEWKLSYSIYWQHGLHKNFWGEHSWDFLVLTQNLYSDYHKTLVSDRLAALADFLVSRKKYLAAHECYRLALAAQPLNWPLWLRYTGYLKLRCPSQLDLWQEAHDLAVSTLATTHHDAAATLMVKYIYPNLLPLVEKADRRNKLFGAFLSKCETQGSNRWDISRLLSAQIATFTEPKDREDYFKDTLKELLSRPDYAAAALAWGLEYVNKLAKTSPETAAQAEELTDAMLSMMSRANAANKSSDALWAALGECIHTAEEFGDRAVFQAIGKLAHRKFKDKFSNKRARFKAFPGTVVSTSALIKTATTVDPGQMAQCCMHWAVLQRTGGSIPGKFEGNSGMELLLRLPSVVRGVVVLSDKPLDKERAFYLQTSADGQEWKDVPQEAVVSGNSIRFDLRKAPVTTQHIRLLREGDKYEPTITGFYVYGKVLKPKKPKGSKKA